MSMFREWWSEPLELDKMAALERFEEMPTESTEKVSKDSKLSKDAHDSSVFDKVTIIITRHYENFYLLRLLKYYRSYDFPVQILILDSSNIPINFNKQKDLLDNKKIAYKRFDHKINMVEKLAKGLSDVSTTYSVICADDDFITPKAIEECVRFLEQNPEYSVAQGLYCSHYLSYSRKNQKEEIEFVWVPSEIARSITYDKPSERLRYHLAHYTGATFFAVHRTHLMQLIWEETIKYTSDIRFEEILSSALSLIYGKMIILPVFYASREIIANSAGRVLDPWHVLAQRDDFQTRCEKVINCLAEHLCRQEPLSVEASNKIARGSLGAYLKFTKGYRKRRCGKTYNLLKKALEKCHLKGLIVNALNLRRRYLDLRYFQLRKVKKKYSPLLEKENSRFYSDFSRVKDIVIRSHINVQNC